MNNSALNKSKNGAFKTFFWALIMACAIFVPLIVYNRGYFLFLGDFNVQQIPFYQLAHEAVKSGNIFWNWHTDLGANFIGSYSFYLLFSPFFWLTLPFPNHMLPLLMGPLLILKTTCAALTSYYYIKRFVKNADWAVIGSVLYAFSGFMTFNIFFNHFHDVCVFFPLLLISLEELVVNGRRGFFGFMVALNCMVNYWFFIGEVIFVIIYVIVRIATGGWGCTVGKFFNIAFESVVGVCISACFLLPSVLAIMGNPRTASDSLLSGWLMWIYGYNQRLPAIIQSFFFPPELPSRPSFFPEMGAKWSSLSTWLPLFSASGVIAFCQAKKRDFHKRMIIISMIISLVPIFNSVFVLFNDSYYARWFYMPVLMMCVATASALENREQPAFSEGWKSGWRWVAGFIVFFTAAVAFSPVYDKANDSYSFGLYQHEVNFMVVVIGALVCLVLSAILIFGLLKSDFVKQAVCLMLSFVIVAYSTGYICSGKYTKQYDDWFIDVPINGQLSLPDEGFVRSDFYNCMDNLGMHFGVPNIQAFHSIVPPSTMEFYPYVGIKRDVSSKPDSSYDALRSLLSVKWLFIAANEQEQQPMPEFSYYGQQLGYNIYQNDRFLPMGFGYDKVITKENSEKLEKEQIVRHMLGVLELSDAAIVRNFDIIEELSAPDYSLISEEGLSTSIKQRSRMTCSSFVTDNRGFTATSNLPKDTMMFFSVPYDEGWTAYVNGQHTIIEKANTGFMAVRVPAGQSTIRFDYTTPGLITGIKISLISLIVMAVYLIFTALFLRKKAPVTAKESVEVNTATALPSMPSDQLQNYLETLNELPPLQDTPKEEKK